MSIKTNQLKITDDYLLVVDKKTLNIIDAINFGDNFKILLPNGMSFSIPTKEVLFEHPNLLTSELSYLDKKYKIKTRPERHYNYKPESNNNPHIRALKYDLFNSSKYLVSAERMETDGTQTPIFLILSGVRNKDNDYCYADIYDGVENLYVNITIPIKQASKLYRAKKKSGSLAIEIDSEYVDIENQSNYLGGFKPAKVIVITSQQVFNVTIDEPNTFTNTDEESSGKKLPYSSSNAVWKTAWVAAGLVANSELPTIPFNPKKSREAFTKMYSSYVGFDKDRNTAMKFSFNSDQFYSKEEMKELIDKYDVFNNIDKTYDTNGNGMFIMDGGVVVRNTTNAISINDEGIDLDNLRINTSVMRASSGLIPVETTTLKSNDIRPVSNLMLTSPRQVPNIFELQKTFDIIYALGLISLDTFNMIKKSEDYYSEYTSRVEQGK